MPAISGRILVHPIRTARAVAVVLSAVTALLSPASAHVAEPARAAAPGDTVTLPVRDALPALPVQSESRTGYEHTKLKHWTDANHDSCNTRFICTLRSGQSTPLVHMGLSVVTSFEACEAQGARRQEG
ncbi:hypothetical protein [Streptomyces sp. NPDC050528]|uniref:hypothetical protein n=1 Tax=Streptomyces sp. NPDC050528 TaxID=3365623 RepID=UPI0037961E53